MPNTAPNLASNPSRPSPLDAFFELAARSLAAGELQRIVLSKPRGQPREGDGAEAEDDSPLRITARPFEWRGQPRLALVASHRTKDLTEHLPPAQALDKLRSLVGSRFAHAHLLCAHEDAQLRLSRKGAPSLLRSKAQREVAPAAAHDRAKQRWLDIGRPFLVELGISDREHRLVPTMARKWRQINKFVEIIDHALDSAGLKQRDASQPLRVLDFGAGKGYLTFALHDHLTHSLGRAAEVTGVELRADLVALTEGIARRLQAGGAAAPGLHYREGDVRSFALPATLDLMIALHACDTATDHALHAGIVAQAALIVAAPCCHKQLRPQMCCPPPLAPMLRHGIHLGEQAEMLTDALRALWLEAQGYDTQVFEFVSLEHTAKNKMILAQRRADAALPTGAARRDAARAQAAQLMQFYGVREQCLGTLLDAAATA